MCAKGQRALHNAAQAHLRQDVAHLFTGGSVASSKHAQQPQDLQCKQSGSCSLDTGHTADAVRAM